MSAQEAPKGLPDLQSDARALGETLTLEQARAELERLEGQQAVMEKALDAPTMRGEAIRVVLAELVALAERAEGLERALGQAIAEIEGTPYQKHGWGWGISYRIKDWKAALAVSTGRQEQT